MQKSQEEIMKYFFKTYARLMKEYLGYSYYDCSLVSNYSTSYIKQLLTPNATRHSLNALYHICFALYANVILFDDKIPPKLKNKALEKTKKELCHDHN